MDVNIDSWLLYESLLTVAEMYHELRIENSGPKQRDKTNLDVLRTLVLTWVLVNMFHLEISS